MAGVSGNIATLAIGKQSAKGTPQGTPTYRMKFTGGNVEGRRDTIQLAETDSTRQQGNTVVVGSRVEGSSEHYIRPNSFALLSYLMHGAIATTGAGPYTHTITPATSLPYATLFKSIGGLLADRYSDCWINSLGVRGAAGGALTCSVGWLGLTPEFGATDPGTPAAETQNPHVYPEVTVTIGGATTAIVESFDMNFENQAQLIPGDTGLYMADMGLGELQVRGTMTLLFESDAEYRRHLTGSTSGTAPTTTVASQTLSIKALVSGSLSVEWVFAGVAWTEFPVNPDPGGAPIKVAAGFYSLPQAAIGDYLKTIVINSVASY